MQQWIPFTDLPPVLTLQVQVVGRKHSAVHSLLVASDSTLDGHLLRRRLHHELLEVLDLVHRARAGTGFSSINVLSKSTQTLENQTGVRTTTTTKTTTINYYYD